MRAKMSPADRAKQFMPFAALKGYEAALRAKERVVVPKVELSEEMADALDWTLRSIEKNDMVTIIYFSDGQYVKVTGMVSRIDRNAKILKVVNTKIPFADIYDLQKGVGCPVVDIVKLP